MLNNYLKTFNSKKEFMSHLANERVRESEKEAIQEKEQVDKEIEVGNNQDDDEKAD
jgi:hypothetical protein